MYFLSKKICIPLRVKFLRKMHLPVFSCFFQEVSGSFYHLVACLWLICMHFQTTFWFVTLAAQTNQRNELGRRSFILLNSAEPI